VFVKAGLAHAEHVAYCFQSPEIRAFVGGVVDDEQDVDDGLGGEPRHGRGADVFDQQLVTAERLMDLLRLAGEAARPAGVMVDHLDVGTLDLADQDLGEVLFELVF